MSISKVLLLALLSLSICNCRSGFAIAETGFCADMSIADIRIGYGYCSAGDVELTPEEEAVSEEGRQLIEHTVEQAVRAALICAGIGAVGSAAGAACSVLDLPVPPEVTE